MGVIAQTVGVAATAPSQFGSSSWLVTGASNQLSFNIQSLPTNGGSPITDIQYSLDGGSNPVSLGTTTTGLYNVTGITPGTYPNIVIRAVNAVGNGVWSAVQSATVGSGSGNLSVSLSANRIFGTAPMGVILTATGTSDAARVAIPYYDIEHTWTFDNPGNYTELFNSPIWGTSRNIAFGPKTFCVLQDPGDYFIECTSTDGENVVTNTIQITVSDPDTVYSGADTCVLSTSSNWNGEPTGANRETSVAAAIAYAEGRTKCRLLIHVDEDLDASFDVDMGSSTGKFALGRYGHSSDERPRINRSSSGGNAVVVRGANLNEISVSDVRILGEFDPTALSQPNNPGGSGITFSLGSKPIDAHKTVWNCEMKNLGGKGIEFSGDGSGDGARMKNMYAGNTSIIGWFDYGVFSGDCEDVGFAGCTIQQPAGTVNGNGKNTGAPYWADHGPWRTSRPAGDTVVSNCDLTSFNSWSAANTSRSFQSIFRWNSGTHSDAYLVLDRLRLEGGKMELYNDTNGGAGVTDNFIIVDRVHHVNGDHTTKPFVFPMGGTTVRNYIGVLPNSKPATSTGTRAMFGDDGLDNDTIVSGAQTRRSECYSCAFIDLRSDANATNRAGTASERNFNIGGYNDQTNVYFGNNIGHAPNMVTGGQTAYAPLNANPNWTPLGGGGELWEGAPADSDFAYGNEVTALFEPESGSFAIGAASSGKTSLLDFYGNDRATIAAAAGRANNCQGPIEVALAA